MVNQTWALRLLNIWILIWGLLIVKGLTPLLTGVSVGGLRLPLGFLPALGLVVAGIVVFKRSRGARLIATGVLAWTTFGLLQGYIMCVFGAWEYQYTPVNVLFTVVYLVLNGACFVHLWFNKHGDPYVANRESDT